MSEVMTASSLLIAAAFIVAAFAKLRDRRRFAEELCDYALLPAAVVSPVSIALPVAELATALMLCVPSTRMIGAAALLVLLALFTGAVVINLVRGNTEISCACFGAESQHLSIAVPGRNVAMAVPLAGGLAAGFAPAPSFSAMIAAALAALLLVLVVTAVEMRDSADRLAERTKEVIRA